MDRIYIIGNGFDCSHNLKTKYSDFIKWYILDCFSKANSDGKYEDFNFIIIRNNILRSDLSKFLEIKDYFDFRCDGIMPISQYKESTDHGRVSFQWKINSHFTKSLIESCVSYGWVDIEREFYSWLKKSANVIPRYAGFRDDIDILNNCFETIKNKLIEYLTTLPNTEMNSEMLKLFDLNSISDNDFKKRREYLVINFNYTNTVAKYIWKKPIDEQIGLFYTQIDVHGSIDNPNIPIIFGYGDETDKYFLEIEELENRKYTRFFKSNGYGLSQNYRIVSKFIDNEDFDVYILGHSCGGSDRVLLKAIFDNIKCKEIKIFHHERNDETNDYLDIYQNIGKCFSVSNRHAFKSKTIPYSKFNSLPQLKQPAPNFGLQLAGSMEVN